ncbi:cytochrome c/c1 heme-lyase [Mucor mucedo]|uniref:cytochrome c/c1 heme-lyase n=1 Tax=Mucor mucedo TaxID=29922 RepID=UPI00221EA223|nr:cytochrome c/c1 heme-lyase [Mucor mucedo]KAI7866304.1 cytochrome c/c1 heme-lyase [Mucor mucedo]
MSTEAPSCPMPKKEESCPMPKKEESCPMPKKEESCPMPKKEESCPMPKKEEASCPMPKKVEEKKKTEFPPGCPMHKGGDDELNKLNMIPNLTQSPQADQTVDLPTERVTSSIPKAKGATSKWEYPSPQQFYNALRRKGWETPENEIETMVDIHNFLNEEAWNEVLKWESKYKCDCAEDPYLSKFQGRPQDITPKAQWHSLFGAPKPFDRHDWYISRCGQSRRYVIDYYEAPEEVPGVPVFHLDVRPALDNAESVMVRFKEAAKMKWDQWFPTAAEKST